MRISQNSVTQSKTNSQPISNNTSYKPNFKGLDSVVIATMDTIERGGTFASFVTQDFLGAILPRPLAGLSRNKKENGGKANTKFALKEVLREFITGPSMFVIPMGILTVAKKHVGRALNVPGEFISGLGDIFKETVEAEKLVKPEELKKLKESYYKKVFENVLTTTTKLPKDHEELIGNAEEMAKKLIHMEDQVTNKNKASFFDMLKGKNLEGTAQGTMGELTEMFTSFTKKHLTDPNADLFNAKFTTQIKNGKDQLKEIGTPFSRLITHLSNYANDAIEKTAKESSKGFKTTIKEFVDNFNYKRMGQRFGLNIGMTLAVVAFLAITPNIYNRGKENPGLIGLETPPNDPAKTNEEAKDANK